MKKIQLVVAAVALCALGVGAWWLQNRPSSQPASAAVEPGAKGRGGASGQAPAATGPVPVEVAQASLERIEDDALAVGTLRSRQGVMLRPEVSGRVARLGFADGQRVRKGQLLAQLDDTLQQAQLQQAVAQEGIARTQLQRNRDLVAQNFVTQSALDQAAANLEVAQAQVALARAQVQRLRIVAPFDGTMGIRSVNVGDYVKDGADLVQIEDTSGLVVDVRLPERYSSRLRAGQLVSVKVDAIPGREFAARVEAVDAVLDANGRSLLARARLTHGDGVLRSGMFARARIVFGVRERAVTVPEEALVPQGEQQYLVKVVTDVQGRQVSQRMVAKIGARSVGRVEILEGLAARETVVVAGQPRLMKADGLRVRVIQVGAESGSRPASAASSSQPAAIAASGRKA
ncbi:MAG: efflux RND transporter periplasmic adaptor subunit [Aquabacterium sp.]|nr:efflux RND transporter periplasmic adaptor subunit [Aquabacterium sp.]